MSTCEVFCITNMALCKGDFITRIERIAKARPSAIILREKQLPPEEYKKLAVQVQAICAFYGTPFIPHYFEDISGAINSKCLHMPFDRLNKVITEKFKVTGTSCHSVQQAAEAQKMGCKYIIAGHIFPTECKNGVPARGVEFLRQVCSAVTIPVYAIGGINALNAKACIQAGAAGVCSMSGFMQCNDAAAYIKELKNG